VVAYAKIKDGPAPTFSPMKDGAVQGTIAIIDNASSKPQAIELLGTGT